MFNKMKKLYDKHVLLTHSSVGGLWCHVELTLPLRLARSLQLVNWIHQPFRLVIVQSALESLSQTLHNNSSKIKYHIWCTREGWERLCPMYYPFIMLQIDTTHYRDGMGWAYMQQPLTKDYL